MATSSQVEQASPHGDRPYWGGGFLWDPEEQSVLLHLRDSKTSVNPNKWAFFGGLAERGESPAECFVREVQEELGLRLNLAEVRMLTHYLNTALSTYRYVFYIECSRRELSITLTEGAGFDWIPLRRLRQYDLTDLTVRDLNVFRTALTRGVWRST